MIAVVPIAAGIVLAKQAPTYKIVQIDRKAVFAGKLGDLVHESLVVERDGTRYTIDVRGDYHTRCVRSNQRFHEGDMVRVGSQLSGDVTIDRDSIKR